MNERIKNFIFGATCCKCKALGVFCVQQGLLPCYPTELCTAKEVPVAPLNGCAVYIDRKQKLQTKESIDKCPAVTGQNTNEEVVSKLRKTAEEICITF
jgi:hypothetical protein